MNQKILMLKIRKQVLSDENINKGITISKNGGISRDPNVILQDENVKRLLRLIKENN